LYEKAVTDDSYHEVTSNLRNLSECLSTLAVADQASGPRVTYALTGVPVSIADELHRVTEAGGLFTDGSFRQPLPRIEHVEVDFPMEPTWLRIRTAKVLKVDLGGGSVLCWVLAMLPKLDAGIALDSLSAVLAAIVSDRAVACSLLGADAGVYEGYSPGDRTLGGERGDLLAQLSRLMLSPDLS
jgi:hypothetical protein